uniref:ribosomal protein S13 n=1 Tax=Phytophthora cinnamomi TaxID=4785 RepID=UPI0020284468|nr:ribosomal protein S13 [Phytophthora cinnamomi]DAZ88728.1 TPA_asm: ribosomal protein S13 [Phytophthora cinnamomi var. cinnamomi]UXG55799.1 ribosomal protein S13 [Phytophthora cinnamomi]WRY73334.1 ribosomal protein S13 [Phytophthora cinnamomi]WRY73414.1 ribosomal protein S13 [Phytophthora cinnamomi]WRY73454.1 ribosomal protein S13 [Phytophthora cinnamomi]
MLYIFNKTISDSKSILYSLTILFGINEYQSKKICKNIGINPQITLNKLKNNHVNRLINYINKNLKVEQLLKKSKTERINELVEIKSNRGIRQSQGLPVRGQRTHTNAKTSKKLKKIFIQKRISRNKRPFKVQKKKKK